MGQDYYPSKSGEEILASRSGGGMTRPQGVLGGQSWCDVSDKGHSCPPTEFHGYVCPEHADEEYTGIAFVIPPPEIVLLTSLPLKGFPHTVIGLYMRTNSPKE